VDLPHTERSPCHVINISDLILIDGVCDVLLPSLAFKLFTFSNKIDLCVSCDQCNTYRFYFAVGCYLTFLYNGETVCFL